MNILEIVNSFRISGKVANVIPFGNGHINDTYRVCNGSSQEQDYLLQRINHQVFPQVKELMNNIQIVTEHINSKAPGTTLSLILTKEGKNYFQSHPNQYWRMFVFHNDLISFDVAKTLDQIYEGGKAFGQFLFQLSDLPAQNLFPIIPNFHNVLFRIQNLKRAIELNSRNRKKQAKELINYALSVSNQLAIIEKLGKEGQIPLRVTHNDTKFNNLLLDNNGKGRCVIDLETVMPGYVHYDFGDGIRTTITTADEDESDLSLIQADLERFRAFAQGYLESTSSILTPIELQYLPLSGALLSYLMGIRFLTDFLQGDIYYKIKHPNHNFQRARAQLNLTQKIVDRQQDLKRCISQFIT